MTTENCPLDLATLGRGWGRRAGINLIAEASRENGREELEQASIGMSFKMFSYKVRQKNEEELQKEGGSRHSSLKWKEHSVPCPVKGIDLCALLRLITSPYNLKF